MTPEKLRRNLKKLRSAIARKSSEHGESGGVVSIEGAFTKYTRTRTINLLSAINEVLLAHKWPFPAYALEEKWLVPRLTVILVPFLLVEKARMLVSFRTPLRGAQPLSDHQIEFIIRKSMVRIFRQHRKKIFLHWKHHPMLSGKYYEINNIQSAYRKKYWYACIASALPLLDLLCRIFLNTKRLERNFTYLIGRFKDAGISSREVQPGHIAWELAEEKGDGGKITDKDFRFVGIILGSFIDFASVYYSWYRKDCVTEAINRHAILHGAAEDLWTEENAVRILTFIDLVLRSEPIFRILLKEE